MGDDMGDDVGLLVNHDDPPDSDDDAAPDSPLLEASWEDEHRLRQANYGRLCTLLIGEGTKCIRTYIKQNLKRGGAGFGGLAELFKVPRVQKQFMGLKKSRVLAAHQYKILYPDDGSPFQESDVDISLWVILARHLMDDDVTSLINWERSPSENDDLPPHHMLRLREARNRLQHVSGTELTAVAFEQQWRDIARSLVRLGADPSDLHRLRTRDLDPSATRACVAEVRAQSLGEQNTRLEAESWHRLLLLRLLGAVLVIFVLAFAVTVALVVRFSKETACANYVQPVRTTEALMLYMPRSGWGARNPEVKHMNRFHGPVDYMVVSQTALNGNCLNTEDCCQACQKVQDFNMGKDVGMSDVAFNYMIGGDGVAYEGRGQFYTPAVAPGWNKKMLTMGFIGYFTDNKPTQEALNAAKILIQYLVDIGGLSHNTTVLGLCQIYGSKYPRSPGIAIMNEMKTWSGNGWAWKPDNSTQCQGFNVSDLLR